MPEQHPSLPASSAHEELVSRLREADDPAAWMSFMESVTRLLPDVLSTGRPSAEAIKNSIIGGLGFASWSEMIEAPIDQGGLGWNLSAWKAWRRAWAVVQQHPWLRSQSFTSSEINTLANDLKRAGADFPGSLDELEAIKSTRQKASQESKESALRALTAQAKQYEKEAREAQAAVAALQQQLAGTAERERAAAETIGALRAQVESLKNRPQDESQAVITVLRQQLDDAAERERISAEIIGALKTQVESLQDRSLPEPPEKLTRWQHLRAFLTGE